MMTTIVVGCCTTLTHGGITHAILDCGDDDYATVTFVADSSDYYASSTSDKEFYELQEFMRYLRECELESWAMRPTEQRVKTSPRCPAFWRGSDRRWG